VPTARDEHDVGIRRAFAALNWLLFRKEGEHLPAESRHAGGAPLDLATLQTMVGFEPGTGQLEWPVRLTGERGFESVAEAILTYHHANPSYELGVQITDSRGRSYRRWFAWDSRSWTHRRKGGQPPPDPASEIQVLHLQGEYFAGFGVEEARQFRQTVDQTRRAPSDFVECPRDRARVFYARGTVPGQIACPKCGNRNLINRREGMTLQEVAALDEDDELDELIASARRLMAELKDLAERLERRRG
jgi:hypothetical protein